MLKCAKRNISLCSSVEQKMSGKQFNWELKICPKFQVLTYHFSMITDDVDILLEQSKKENAAYKNMAQVYKSHSMV